MARLKRDKLIDSKDKDSWRRKGENDQDGHNNEESVLERAPWHNSLSKHWQRFRYLKLMKNKVSLMSYVTLKLISNNRRWYLEYNVALKIINGDEDLDIKSVESWQINDWTKENTIQVYFISLGN